MFVYLIINTATQKYYVGQHKGTNLKKYLQQKLSHANSKKVGSSRLFNSMRKHPKDVWEILPLVSDIGTREAVDAWEQTLIELFDSRNPEFGYNICRGGEGFSGSHSFETKQKIADASREMWKRPDIKEHFTTMMTGRKRPPEVCAILKIVRNQRDPVSEDTKERSSIAHMGLVRSLDSRLKQSASTSGGRNHASKSVRCLDTGEVFTCLADAANQVSRDKAAICLAIKRGGKCAGKRYEYVEHK